MLSRQELPPGGPAQSCRNHGNEPGPVHAGRLSVAWWPWAALQPLRGGPTLPGPAPWLSGVCFLVTGIYLKITLSNSGAYR